MEDHIIIKNFNKIFENKAKLDALQKQIIEAVDFDSWFKIINQLSDIQYNINCENKKLIDEIIDFFNFGAMAEESYEALFNCVIKMYVPDYSDFGLENRFNWILIPYYEKKGDITKLLYLYLRTATINMEFARSGIKEYQDITLNYFEKLTFFRTDKDLMKNPKNLLRVILAYANLCLASVPINLVSIKRANELFDEYMAFASEPDIAELIKNDESLTYYSDYIIRFYKKMTYFCFQDQDLDDPELKNTLLKYAKEVYLDEDLKPLNNYSSNETSCFYCTYAVLAAIGQISYDECFQIMLKHLNEKDNFDPENILNAEDPGAELVNGSLILIGILDKTSLPPELKNNYVISICDDLFNKVRRFTHNSDCSYTVNNALSQMGRQKEVYSNILTIGDKKEMFTRLTVSRHFSTYIHSNMVACISTRILEEIFDTRAELLLGCNGISDIEDIKNHREELLKYTKRAAMIHDVGKNSIIDIINVTHRPLTDVEYRIIQKHPVLGCDYLKVDPALEEFSDVILGHHKFYDGSSGYEQSFDNTASPHRLIIDIVTIADCMDAATDYLGRSFKASKNFRQLIEELEAQAGTRYNKDLVDLIKANESLYKDLNAMVSYGRIDIYRKAFEDYINI